MSDGKKAAYEREEEKEELIARIKNTLSAEELVNLAKQMENDGIQREIRYLRLQIADIEAQIAELERSL